MNYLIRRIGFYLVAAYPTHSEALTSIVIQATGGITYDIVHVCRKRLAEPLPIPWSKLRKDVLREARAQLSDASQHLRGVLRIFHHQ